jgi:hypothetical protein
MDVREKLVELLGKVQDYGTKNTCEGWSVTVECKDNETIADHLISHDVTVQEWISVNDRLPQSFVSVLGYMTDAGEFPPVRECYTVGNAFFFPALGDVHPVSHWCEMPQPPKGE